MYAATRVSLENRLAKVRSFFSFCSLEKMKKISLFTRNFALICFAKKESEVLCAINSCSYNTFAFREIFFSQRFYEKIEIRD